MNRYVALLRGINVGGKNTVKMADLRSWVEDVGHTEVTTYINSGNVIFTSGASELDNAGLATIIEEKITAESGLRIAVMVRAGAELAAAVAANPFPDAEPSRLLLAFMNDEPDEAMITAWTGIESGDDAVAAVGTVAYLHCPDGAGRSKLAEALAKRSAPLNTTRNLRTVRKLLELLE